MKDYYVQVDITVSRQLYVEADNIQDARKTAEEKIGMNVWDYARNPDAIVDFCITDIDEDP